MLRKLLSLGCRVLLRLSDNHQYEMTSLDAGPEWFQLINSVNRRLLLQPPADRLRRPGIVGRLCPTNLKYADDCSWKIAMCALGAEWAHRIHGQADDLAALERFFERNIDQQGNWQTPINLVDHAMKGSSLLYLAGLTGEPRYQKAADQLADSLLNKHPRLANGVFPYRPESQIILVDALAMVCPFLARYANQVSHPEAMQVSVCQLIQFVRHNVDHETHLPYHGYYADGPRRLGMHGWGRGVGWYMVGLVDTLIELPQDQPDSATLLDAYLAAADTLRQLQRPDGHWHWAPLHKTDNLDSSTTSLVGYSLARGIQAGFLDESFSVVTRAALRALVNVTRVDGLLMQSLGECQGLGKYPQQFGPALWLQGAATGFAALHLGKA